MGTSNNPVIAALRTAAERMSWSGTVVPSEPLPTNERAARLTRSK